MRDWLFAATTPFLAGFVAWRVFFREAAVRWVRHARRPQVAASAALASTVLLALIITGLLVSSKVIDGVVTFLTLVMIGVVLVLVLAAGIGRASED